MSNWTLKKLFELEHKDSLVPFLQNRGLLPTECNCPNCGAAMKISGENWRCRRTSIKNCRKITCDVKISLKKTSWFSRSRMSFATILQLTYMLTRNYEQKAICHELELNKNTVSQWSYYFRQIVLEWSLQRSETIGGVEKIVEIDESKFGKRKYNKGRRVEGQWIFGGVERNSGKLFMVPVEKRDSATLIAIIKQWILPGTTIYSDMWKAYESLGAEGYEHLTVNHSVNFVDPDTLAHTNGIESYWRHAKHFLPHYCRKKENYSGYLAHYMFVKSVESAGKDIYEEFLNELAKLQFLEDADSDHDTSEEED